MKAIGVLTALLVVALLAVSADASILLSDTFSYPDGSLVPNNGWVNHSGIAGDLLVSGEEVVVQHGVPSEDAHSQWADTAGSLYYGINFSVDDLGAPYSGTDNEYFAHFMADSTFNFRAKLDVGQPTGGGDYTVGISTVGSVAEGIWATDLTYGTTYRAIVKYDQALNTSQLWIDAKLPTETSVLGADESDPGDLQNSFGLRQSDSSENETVRVDNLIVATTFAEVVPEPATIVLLGLGGLALIRRRR